MSDNSRNSRFQRKSGKKRPLTGKSNPDSGSNAPAAPKRARGMLGQPQLSAPQSPKNRNSKPPRINDKRPTSGREGGAHWIWGLHAAKAALNNPKRTLHDILVSETLISRLELPKTAPTPKIVPAAVIDKQFPSGTAHQGIVIKAAPLEWPDISDIAAEKTEQDGLILVLDQITDPHNVGAMLRLASAFGARAVVMQDRKAPPLSGATAKVATGCVETVPVCLVTNIANTLEDLKTQGWFITGLAGETELELSQALSGNANHAIVMGAEGPGLRPRVRKACDQLARIPMTSDGRPGTAESLNVATAAAIALYEAKRKP